MQLLCEGYNFLPNIPSELNPSSGNHSWNTRDCPREASSRLPPRRILHGGLTQPARVRRPLLSLDPPLLSQASPRPPPKDPGFTNTKDGPKGSNSRGRRRQPTDTARRRGSISSGRCPPPGALAQPPLATSPAAGRPRPPGSPDGLKPRPTCSGSSAAGVAPRLHGEGQRPAAGSRPRRQLRAGTWRAATRPGDEGPRPGGRDTSSPPLLGRAGPSRRPRPRLRPEALWRGPFGTGPPRPTRVYLGQTRVFPAGVARACWLMPWAFPPARGAGTSWGMSGKDEGHLAAKAKTALVGKVKEAWSRGAL